MIGFQGAVLSVFNSLEGFQDKFVTLAFFSDPKNQAYNDQFAVFGESVAGYFGNPNGLRAFFLSPTTNYIIAKTVALSAYASKTILLQ